MTAPPVETPLSSCESEHHVELPGGEWRLWREVCLRSAGFPVRQVLVLADDRLAGAVSSLLGLEEEVERLREATLSRLQEMLAEIDALSDDEEQAREGVIRALRDVRRGREPEGWEEVWGDGARRLRRLDRERTEAREQLRTEYERARAENTEALREVASEDRFREAVAWQNRKVLERGLDRLVERSHSKASRRRYTEALVAAYLQRYCTKNDTIGFFGPSAWVRLESQEEGVLRYQPGKRLLARREVFFERWGIQHLAQTLAGWSELAPWLAPRLRSCCQLDGDVLYRPLVEPLALSPERVRLLSLCDGRRTAREVADRLAEDAADPATRRREVFAELLELERQQILAAPLRIPLDPRPERILREHLERIGPENLRRRASAPLDRLEGSRQILTMAAGDAGAVDSALRSLERDFRRSTGKAAYRKPGKTYAGRSLVYEDCRRDLDLELGRDLLSALGAPLSLVLGAGRWLVGALRERVERRLLDLLEVAPAAPGGGAEMGSAEFYTRARAELFEGEADPLFAEVEVLYQQRWERLLSAAAEETDTVEPGAAERLAPLARELFACGAPPWQLGRFVSPDLMIDAAGPEALARGEMELVLGEIHVGNTLMSSALTALHPNPERLQAALQASRGDSPVLLPHQPEDAWLQRVTPLLGGSGFFRFDLRDVPPRPGDETRSLPAAALVVTVGADGRPTVATRDGDLRFDAVDLLAFELNPLASSILGRRRREAAHLPRITIDRCVLDRESWGFTASELDWSRRHDREERYLEIRRWARSHGLPRFFFCKVPHEVKPTFTDLDSPVLVDLFASAVRRVAKEEGSAFRVTEMLPAPGGLWLSDAVGDLYTCELRLGAIDSQDF